MLTMFEIMNPVHPLEESKNPELAQIKLAEESRVSPWVDEESRELLGISSVEMLQFKRVQLWREK